MSVSRLWQHAGFHGSSLSFCTAILCHHLVQHYSVLATDVYISVVPVRLDVLIRAPSKQSSCLSKHDKPGRLQPCIESQCHLYRTKYHFKSQTAIKCGMSTSSVQRNVLQTGLLADKLIKSGWSVTRVRKSLQTVAFLGPALALIVLSRSKDPRLAVACMTCALGITSLGKTWRCYSANICCTFDFT